MKWSSLLLKKSPEYTKLRLVLVAIASKNPVKVKAVKKGFEKNFPQQSIEFKAVKTQSGVSDQPSTDKETFTGAKNRCLNAQSLYPSADYYCGLEGGIHKNFGHLQSFAWVCILHQHQIHASRTATFSLPQKVISLINQGEELGVAMDKIHHRKNTKHAEGAVGILTHNTITRTTLYTPAVILALSAFNQD